MSWRSVIPAIGAVVTAALIVLLSPGLSPRALARHAVEAQPSGHAAAQEATSPEELVEKYPPILYLREQSTPCGDGEAFNPGPVEMVLDQPDVYLRQLGADESAALEAPGVADIFGKDESYYIDWPGNPRKPGCTYEEDYRRLTSGDEPLIYAHIAREEGHDGFAVQYFFFYYYNHFLNKHEGDWEKIQLAFDAESIEQAIADGPVRVAYSGHAGGERADWSSGKVTKEGERPVVYVAEGSHASYFEQGRYIGVARGGGVFGCETTETPHRRVDPVVQLLPDEVTDPNDEFAWIEYDGLWGQYEKSGLYTGISGPKKAQAWTEPFSWEAGLRSWSEKLPEDESLGFDPVKPFCFVVGRGSMLLNLAHENPVTVGGGTVLLVASAFGLLVLGVPQRTFGSRFQTRPDSYSPFEFRRKRNLGQIGRAGLVLYRRNLALFLTIGLAFILLGTIATSIQAPIAIRDLIDSPFAEAVLVLTAGSAQVLVALLVVEASLTVALNGLSQGASPTLRDVFRGVLARFWRTVAARSWATAQVVILFISIIGSPWAINRSVCWLFTEQMIIIENRRPGDALSASRSIVKGSWRRTLGFIMISAVLLIVPGSVIGVFLLLFAPPPASDAVYLVNGLLYGLLLAPVFVISKVLFYFDLTSPDEVPATQPSD